MAYVPAGSFINFFLIVTILPKNAIVEADNLSLRKITSYFIKGQDKRSFAFIAFLK